MQTGSYSGSWFCSDDAWATFLRNLLTSVAPSILLSVYNLVVLPVIVYYTAQAGTAQRSVWKGRVLGGRGGAAACIQPGRAAGHCCGWASMAGRAEWHVRAASAPAARLARHATPHRAHRAGRPALSTCSWRASATR